MWLLNAGRALTFIIRKDAETYSFIFNLEVNTHDTDSISEPKIDYVYIFWSWTRSG